MEISEQGEEIVLNFALCILHFALQPKCKAFWLKNGS